MSRRLRLADTRRATPGECAICGASATMWLRFTLSSAVYTVAVRACDAHEQAARSAASALTLADIAATVPRSHRARRAASARRRADRIRGVSRDHGRISADLAGASSLSHTHGLLSAYRAAQADAWDALADELMGASSDGAATQAGALEPHTHKCPQTHNIVAT